jgi:hypothetical protein
MGRNKLYYWYNNSRSKAIKTVKTAISIDAGTFRLVNRLSRRLHMSRSSFFSQAARYMVDKNENCELLQRINACFEPAPDEGRRARHEKSYSRRKVLDRW